MGGRFVLYMVFFACPVPTIFVGVAMYCFLIVRVVIIRVMMLVRSFVRFSRIMSIMMYRIMVSSFVVFRFVVDLTIWMRVV